MPRFLKAIACMGGVDLDLTEAELAPGVSEIEAFAFMGGVQIRVPPDAPVLRVRGFALMGGVDVRVREPKPR